jgi:hypothetical protein
MKEQFFTGTERNGLVIVEDFYSDIEMSAIWTELEYLTKENHFLPPSKTGTSTLPDGTYGKNNDGIFLDEFYVANRNESNILNINRKIWSYLNSIMKVMDKDPILRYTLSSNEDSTLISYYTDGHYYTPHIDKSVYTVLTYFFKEPKKFQGGNLKLLDYDMEIEVKNNMVIFMPSTYSHQVTPVIMEKDDGCSGRYCMSQFLFIGNHR